MVKKKPDTSGSTEAYEKLYEVVKNKGDAEALRNVKRSLDDWQALQKLFRKEEPSLKDISEKWKSLQSSSSRSLQSLVSLIALVESDSDSSTSTSSSEKTSKEALSSSSSSDSSSDSPDSDASNSEKDGKGSAKVKGADEAVAAPPASLKSSKPEPAKKSSGKPKSDSSSSSSSSESDSDSDSDSSGAEGDSDEARSRSRPKQETKVENPASSSSSSSSSSSASASSDSDDDSGSNTESSSSDSNSDSSSDTTPDPVSDSEEEEPPRKKRKTEKDGSAVKTANYAGSKANKGSKQEKVDDEPVRENIPDIPTPPVTSTPTVSQNGKGGKQPRKSNTPFQRIKVEAVKFADERLKDNSFVARGAKSGDYGERASADLLVTRGDSFRKEKNKKKRGSYRGGEITMQSHSIKFD